MNAVQARDDKAMLERIARGFQLVTATFPHLSGLAALMRVDLDDRVPTMGVFASGRLVVNRTFTARLSERDLVFVLAHELLHLALRTHDRAVGSGRLEFNFAHDYIINDILRHAMGMTTIPAGGLDMIGAREKAAEEIVLDMRRNGTFTQARTRVFEGEAVSISEALDAAQRSGDDKAGDVLDNGRETQMFPDAASEQAERIRAIREIAAKGMAIGKARGLMRGRGVDAGNHQQNVRALRGVYRTPWQVALQRFIEGVAPGERTFQRASRRGAERDDVVMPGRQRYSTLVNVILDTSGSMANEIPAALGAIADFCEATGVDDIRVVQCDTVVTGDEVLSPTELAQYDIKGYGGSDLTPALALLAADPRVSAAIVITDGDIEYPRDPVPYAVLWAVPGSFTAFAPPYGRVVAMGSSTA
jgi:predicted metal-dependent peptidase